MRRFFSYGPVDCEQHFCVPRTQLIEQCLTSLIGDPTKGGHYFTIWAPRQTGKTWLMRQVVDEIQARYGDQFMVSTLSMQGIIMKEDDPENVFLTKIPYIFYDGFRIEHVAIPKDWESFQQLFDKDKHDRLFDKPIILFIDEFDSLPKHIIDRLVTLFRDIYLKRDKYLIHGLALIGVRAVLGVESRRGSPFNIQRSLHVPNFTREEVHDLYQQYQDESEQQIRPDVVEAVYTTTNGQPGLVSWFGELLTESYNPTHDRPINLKKWQRVWLEARSGEPSNNLLNIIAKARNPEYQPFLAKLFTSADLPFLFHNPLHNYLYLHGILEPTTITEPSGELKKICRFSSPFIQQCLYDALSDELIGDSMVILALEPLDDLEDVFAEKTLNLPALLTRYKDYLARLKAKGLNPWKEQPRRKVDLHLTEAVGHFHLYAWLKDAIGDQCVVSPEFPTGNGKVDIHLKCDPLRGIIEVKSFKNKSLFKKGKRQAARYAKDLKFDAVTMAVFVPVEDEEVLKQLSGEESIDGIRVCVVAIGWV